MALHNQLCFFTAATDFSAAVTVVLSALPCLKPAVTFFEADVSGVVRGLYATTLEYQEAQSCQGPMRFPFKNSAASTLDSSRMTSTKTAYKGSMYCCNH